MHQALCEESPSEPTHATWPFAGFLSVRKQSDMRPRREPCRDRPHLWDGLNPGGRGGHRSTGLASICRDGSVRRESMPAVQGPPQDLGSIGLLIMLIAALCVTYWRTTLRIAAIVIITLAAYGAFLVVEGMRR
jgi:hypothetical protein